MKEVFSRVGITLLLFLLYFEVIAVEAFIPIAVGIYLLRTLIMCAYAFRARMPKLIFEFPKNTRNILVYTTLIILGGSAAVVLLEIDKVMINQFIEIENVAYYSVAGFIAMVIAVPSRSMHQITYPLTAELLNKRDTPALKALYQRSSLTLFIVSGLLFILILLNLRDLYELLPEAYRNGFVIFVWLGLARVYDALLGNNNSILYNSDYYRAVLLMGVLLAVMTILFNLWLIPRYGLDGAAIASFSAFFIYNTIKLAYVRLKFGILPFTSETLKVILLLVVIGMSLYFLDFPFHPILNIAIKGLLITLIYVGVLYRFRISEDVFGVISRVFRRE
jgi:O-antigen/teichoic acid export membrane protein